MPSPQANTETIENYLKSIYTLARESPAGEAGMKAIATMTGVTVGTASTMVKRMAAARLARYERFGGVQLTAKGERAAIDVLRRHRLIETFLVQTLKLDWSMVHDEAERLEHAFSPVVIEALDAFLGHPTSDPHGDPIPDAHGKTREPRGKSLSVFTIGTKFRVLRITDQDGAFLSFVAAHGLRPGARGTVTALDAPARAVTVQATGFAAVTMATTAADRIVCEVEQK